MSALVARDGDLGSHGGNIKAITSKTYVNGRLVLTPGAIYFCPEHGPNPVVQGSSSVFAEGKPISRIGDLCACGAVIVSSSSNVHSG